MARARAQHRRNSTSASSQYLFISFGHLRFSVRAITDELSWHQRSSVTGNWLAATGHLLCSSGSPSIQQICSGRVAFGACAQHLLDSCTVLLGHICISVCLIVLDTRGEVLLQRQRNCEASWAHTMIRTLAGTLEIIPTCS
jgi:hypothetical protein